MANAHAPHVRTKKPLRGRRVRRSRDSWTPACPTLRHAHCDTHLVRRGPPASRATGTVDVAFSVATVGVVVTAAVLGIAMGVAQPSWLLAAALVGGGALVAAVVALASPRLTASAYVDLR
jgi:hypothetical protein